MRTKWSLILVAAFAITICSFATSVASAAVTAGKNGMQKRKVAFGNEIVAFANQFIGLRYRYGGSSPSTGFDCSGFIMYVYSKFGISLPHNAAAQYRMGASVPLSQLKPGDLVFFNGLGHAGIYVGMGKFIHSPRTGESIRVDSISDNWSRGYVGARRILSA